MRSILSLVGLLLLGVMAVLVQDFNMLMESSQTAERHRSLRSEGASPTITADISDTNIMNSFSQLDIEKALPYFHTWYMRLLVFDGENFTVHAIGHNSTLLRPEFRASGRLFKLVPFLVHALTSNFPDRFKPGKPPFQLLFSEADLISTDCGIDGKICPSSEFPPILAFGSVYKDMTMLPTVKSMPPPARWFTCLYNWRLQDPSKTCPLRQKINFGLQWDELKPQVVWRGADWPFLPHMKNLQGEGFMEVRWKTELMWKGKENRTGMLQHLKEYENDLPPRWKANLWTLEAEQTETPWIDSRFVGGLNIQFRDDLIGMGLEVNGQRIEEFEMSGYKYQVDFGGGGGTTWDGTMAKLLAPGVLFHHETPTKDFFYDDMKPWVHYIPVRTDLTDLKQKFDWAEKNPEGAKLISEEATRFAEHLISRQYLAKTYRTLFIDYLGQVVRSYKPQGKHSLDSLLQQYHDAGMIIHPLSTCDETFCTTNADGVEKRFKHAARQPSSQGRPSQGGRQQVKV
mmetsp:Transcript_5426/g.8897  ORF Transcript_5426/g.8897 Transcript_5426/m.8897 type:complete len:513 (+) Transcript_5426:119-1657(+)|eukprot:CAMPEP_0119012996 /NCGR_PEP_ID=MMETSP1176-20130426/7735_1 /TAXON_ID=265551 /ORGANISM="Synedropsis recta cf, Strain CCMP1620" /LENGTH=512 /DNA_ID=CAMNT_0006966041 /DNA_START=54 /DNA_END=1592 /DNA_ORIENTATION=-